MSPCPDVSTLQQLQEGRLDEAQYRAIEAHVESCVHCQQVLDSLGTLQTGIPLPTVHMTPKLFRPERGPEPMPAVPGYELLEVLGAGGMGVVYKARQLALNRLVALKTIRAGAWAGPEEIERFHREAEAVARLQHANIIQIHDIGVVDGRPYFSMELVEGGSLRHQPAGRTFQEIAALVERLARAMHYAHQRGIVHRDLKPGNVLMTADGTPKIADFGLARQLDAEHSLTPTGGLLGTPAYMAPEQAAGKSANEPITPLADVYALGAILYELLVGRPPFEGLSRDETLHMVRHVEPVPPRRLRPRVPLNLETICLKCLRKEPGKRYASALALAEDLERFGAGRPILARPVGRLERAWTWCRRNPTVAALLALLVLTFLAGSGTVTALWRREVWQRQRAEARQRHSRRVVSEVVGWVDRELRLQQPGTETLRRDLARTALEQVEEYQALVREDEGPDSRELARTEWWRGCLLRVAGSAEEAEPVLRQAIDLQQKLREAQPENRELREDLARSYQSLAIVEGELHRHDEAVRLLRETCDLLGPLREEEPTSVWPLATLAGANTNLGLYASRDAHPEQAQKYLDEANVLWERAVRADAGEPRLRAGQAFGWVNRANLAVQVGEPKQAREFYEKARAALEQLLHDHPRTRAFADTLTVTLHNLAALHTAQGQLGDALAVLERARAVQTELAQASPDALTLRRYQAEHELRMGRVKLKMLFGRSEARDHFRASSNLEDELAKLLGGTRNYERMRAHTYLGVVQAALNQRGDALANWRTALELLKKEQKTPVEPIDDPRERAESCFVLGAGLMNLGRLAESLPVFQRAVRLGDAALARAPHDAKLRNELSKSYFHLGHVQRMLGRLTDSAATCRARQKLWPNNADQLHDAACELCGCAAVLDAQGKFQRVRLLLAQANPWGCAAVLAGQLELSDAQRAARSGYLDEAMEVLGEAVKQGLTGAGRVRRDTDLRMLWERPDFQALVKKMEERERKGRK